MTSLDLILEKLRASLKKRGADGIRGLGIHFRICDRNRNGRLDREEFQKCIMLNKLPLDREEADLLFRTFDQDRSNEISYEEFLKELRGRLKPVRRALVVRVFDVLDRMGGGKGYLTADSIKDVYSTSKHPKVISGAMTKQEALNEFLHMFEGSKGNRDGVVTLAEWIGYYEEVSASVESDDYFGTMMVNTWAHLKKKNADGTRAPAITYASSAEVDKLQRELKASIYQKSTSTNQRLVAERAFKEMDRDGSGNVSMDEFIAALEKFGLIMVGAKDKCPGGWPRDVVTALFTRFDADGSGSLDYREFCDALYAGEGDPPPLNHTFDPLRPTQLRSAETGKLIGKPCYQGNEWLKGSNHIFQMNR